MALGPVTAAPPGAVGRRRLLVVNLEDWGFTRLARRCALDLFPLREESARGSVELWDAGRSGTTQSDRDIDRLWRWWPRPVAVQGKSRIGEVIAEIEERLEADLERRDATAFVLFVVAGTALDDALALLEGLRSYFETRSAQRLNVQIVLVVGHLTGPGPKLGPLPPGILDVGLPVDTVLSIDPRVLERNAAKDSWPETAFALLRLGLDVFGSADVAAVLKPDVGQVGPRQLQLRVDQRLELAGPQYAGTIRAALADAYRQKQAPPTQAEGQGFPQKLARLIGRADGPDDGASAAIVGKVAEGFDARIYRESGDARDDLLVRSRFLAGTTANLGKGAWSDVEAWPAILDSALVGFLSELQRRVTAKIRGQQAALPGCEEAGVVERNRMVGELGELDIALFGTDNRAATHAELAKSMIDAALRRTTSRISDIRRTVGGGSASEPKSQAENLVLTYCPVVNLAWPEFAGSDKDVGLTRAHERARSLIATLPNPPRSALWTAICVPLFLGFPLLWLFGLDAARAMPAIPVVASSLWLGLFAGSIVLPHYRMRRAGRELDAALADVDAACIRVIEAMESHLKAVASYAGEIQRHYFLIKLQRHVADLQRQANLVLRYLDDLDRSLGLQAAPENRDTLQHEALVGAVHGVRHVEQWLGIALRALKLAAPRTLSVHVLGGNQLRVDSQAFFAARDNTPCNVFVEKTP